MTEEAMNGSDLEFEEMPCKWLTCCDCGLVHLLVLTMDGAGNFSLCVFRDDKQTKLERKEMRAEKKAKKKKGEEQPENEA